jgi:competence protein ComEC
VKNPLLAPLLALASGILLARFVPFRAIDFLWTLPLLSGLTWLAWKRSRRALPVCSSLVFLFCGALLALLHRPGSPPEIDAGAHETVLLSGCVVSPSAFSEGRDQFVLELAHKARARVSLSLRDREIPPDLRYGQLVELEARVRRIRNFQNPGEFDYEGFSARSDIYWTAAATGAGSVAIKPGRCGSRFFAALFALRTGALRRIERLYSGNAYATGMMEATLIGESSRMERLWTDHFRRTGTYHMLVIDGLHITILAAFLLCLLRLCFLPEFTALAITASGAWIYALVSGWNAPAIRAAGGFTLYIVARYFYRRGRLLNLLAAVAIVYLIYDPSQLFEAGFQLSFLSVAAIGLLAIPVLEGTSTLYARGLAGITEASRAPRLPPRAAQFRLELRLLAETASFCIPLPRAWWEHAFALAARVYFYAYELAVLSAAIQIGLALPMAIYFHRISLTGISANILVVPLLALVVPLGFLAVFTMWQSSAWTAVRSKASVENVRIVPLSSGRSFDFGGARIDVISPPSDYVPGLSPMNNDSLGLRITYRCHSLLLTGDMEKPMERRALIDGEPLRADILKVGHHGSNTSSIDPFLDAVSPVFAIISDGFENSFRHPHPKVLQRLSAHRAGVLRTDRDGLVTIRTDGRRISVETFRFR